MATKKRSKSGSRKRRSTRKVFCKTVTRRGKRVKMCWQRMSNGCTKITSPGGRKKRKSTSKRRRKASTKTKRRSTRGVYTRRDASYALVRGKGGRKRLRKGCRRVRKGTKSMWYECRTARTRKRKAA